MEIERFEYGDSDGIITKREIDGNTYVVVLYQHTESIAYDKLVLVLGDERTGEDHGFSDHPNTLPSEYTTLVRYEFSLDSDRPVEAHVSEAINEAVCIVEDKKSEEQQLADAVNAAVEANKEVHEGIDYQLK